MLSLRLALLIALALIGLTMARAQISSPSVQAQQPITAGNCAQWVSNFLIGDAGIVCPSGSPCTNQLVLDYSNSCALIAQGWGQ